MRGWLSRFALFASNYIVSECPTRWAWLIVNNAITFQSVAGSDAYPLILGRVSRPLQYMPSLAMIDYQSGSAIRVELLRSIKTPAPCP